MKNPLLSTTPKTGNSSVDSSVTTTLRECMSPRNEPMGAPARIRKREDPRKPQVDHDTYVVLIQFMWVLHQGIKHVCEEWDITLTDKKSLFFEEFLKKQRTLWAWGILRHYWVPALSQEMVREGPIAWRRWIPKEILHDAVEWMCLSFFEFKYISKHREHLRYDDIMRYKMWDVTDQLWKKCNNGCFHRRHDFVEEVCLRVETLWLVAMTELDNWVKYGTVPEDEYLQFLCKERKSRYLERGSDKKFRRV